MKFVKFVNPLNGSVVRLPVNLSLEQCQSICVQIASSTSRSASDRLAAIKMLLQLTGRWEKNEVQSGGSHTLRVVVDQAPASTVTTSVVTSTTTPEISQ